jgi:AbiV family abortive infection protein
VAQILPQPIQLRLQRYARQSYDVNTSSKQPEKPDPALVTAMEACVKHARDLLDSAKAVDKTGHPNIAYHLATLALEELGRRELLGLQWIAAKAKVPPAWPTKNTQDHVKKLFWCFFGAGFIAEKITKERLDEMKGLAQHIHEKRLAGLYVGQDDDGLNIPSEVISPDEAGKLIGLAEARLTIAEHAKLRDEISQEEADQQAWFLTATDDPEKRKQILSSGSLAKLAEFKDANAWVKWLKELFDKAQAESHEAAQREIERSRNLPDSGTKDKWRLRVRILCASHSIRANVLASGTSKRLGLCRPPAKRTSSSSILR